MARQRYRGNNLSSSFPLISSFSGQSVIVPGIDQVPPQQDRNSEQAQAIFLENMMPMANGWQSIGFSLAVARGPAQNFDQAFYLIDQAERKTLFVPANGANYFYDAPAFIWYSQPVATPFGAYVSTALIKGRQFVCYAKHSTFYEWDGLNLNPVIFLGLDPTKIIGIVAASTYLIAFTEKEIFWSSIITPTDFIPSLASGAGGTDVLSLKGLILCAKHISDGFMIFTTANMVAASYTGNVRFPWTFKEIAGGAGIDSPRKVTDAESGLIQFAYTVVGLMQIDRNQAQLVWPEVSEFIAGRRFESYNYKTRQIEEININDSLLTKLSFIAGRYLVISYGDNSLSYALIYDVALHRWGKLAIDHVDCFEFVDQPIAVELGKGIRYQDIVGQYRDQNRFYISYGHISYGPALRYRDIFGLYQSQFQTYQQYGGAPQPGVYITPGQEPYKSIGFLQQNGSVKIVNFDLPLEKQLGVLFLGKYQLSRNRLTELYEMFFENMYPETEVAVLPSFDGFTYEEPIVCAKDKSVSSERMQKFLCCENALSFTLRLHGRFALNSFEMVFGVGGYR